MIVGGIFHMNTQSQCGDIKHDTLHPSQGFLYCESLVNLCQAELEGVQKYR